MYPGLEFMNKKTNQTFRRHARDLVRVFFGALWHIFCHPNHPILFRTKIRALVPVRDRSASLSHKRGTRAGRRIIDPARQRASGTEAEVLLYSSTRFYQILGYCRYYFDLAHGWVYYRKVVVLQAEI